MKRIISFIIAITLFSLCLSVCSFANDSVSFTEDFYKMQIAGQSYSRINRSKLVENYEHSVSLPVTLSERQKESVSAVEITADKYLDVVYATISYNDGSILSVAFLRDSMMDEYLSLVNGTSDNYVIDLEYPYGNTVEAKRDDLFAEKTSLGGKELEYCSYFPVYTQNEHGTLKAQKGSLLIYEDDYYYVDFAEAGVYFSSHSPFIPHQYYSLTARKITNEDLCDRLEEAEEKYYDDDFGFLFDDEFSEKVSTVFIIFVLVILPLATLVVSLIFAIRSKGFYRKLSITVCSLSGASLIVVGIIYAIIQVYS